MRSRTVLKTVSSSMSEVLTNGLGGNGDVDACLASVWASVDPADVLPRVVLGRLKDAQLGSDNLRHTVRSE